MPWHTPSEIRSGFPPIISASLAPLGSCQNDGLSPIPSQSWSGLTPSNSVFPALCASILSSTSLMSSHIANNWQVSLWLPQAPPTLWRTTKRNTKWSLLSPHATRAHAWSISSIGRVGLKLIRPGSPFPTWGTPAVLFGTSMLLILPCHIAFGVFPLLISFSFSAMLGCRLLSLHSHHLIAWKLILRGGGQCCTRSACHGILFTPLFATFLLTMYVMLCKPGCAVSTADMSSV